VMAPPRETARRVRSPSPLWRGEAGEEAQVLLEVKKILEWANREHGASFPIAKSARDTLLYPFERVRGAVANVLLKRARGYRFENPGAVLWDGITFEGYKLEEFSVASFAEVLARIRATRPKDETREPPKTPPPQALEFEEERKRRSTLQVLHDSLPESERQELDRRAEILAREELGEASSPRRLALRKLDKRNELLSALTFSPPTLISSRGDANVSETAPRESQIPHFASERDEPEPIALQTTRT
jgi:hypothetical protein